MPTIALDSTEEGALGLCLVRFKHELTREAPQDERDAPVLSAPNAPLTTITSQGGNDGCKRSYPFPILGATRLAPTVSGPASS
jgi:hypothetical protein